MRSEFSEKDVALINMLKGNKDVQLKELKGCSVPLFMSDDTSWQAHSAKKYSTVIYNRNGTLRWRYDHKNGAIAYAPGGALYTNKWEDAVRAEIKGSLAAEDE
jgi:hypothetical protein